MRTTIKINADRVIALRIERGFSQKQLAGKIGVDSGTVSRWERRQIDRVRLDVLGRLCRALDTTQEVISGEGPLPAKKIARPESEKGSMNLNIDPACRNALALVANRYHVTRQQIVEIAPLLFLIAAEQSLRERREHLAKLYSAADVMLAIKIPHLQMRYPLDDDALTAEESSIASREIFAMSVGEIAGWPEDSERDNPFALYLSKVLADVVESAELVGWEPGRSYSPNYRVCVEEAKALVGNDAEAATAILDGQAPLHDMPKSSPHERARWAREQKQASEQRVLELLGLLDGIEPEKIDATLTKIDAAITKVRENGASGAEDGDAP